MTLVEQQRALAALIKDRDVDLRGDPYLAAVARSASLPLVREIGVWWRGFALEQWCPLTSAALRAAGRFDAELEDFCRDPALPAAFVPLSARFLERCAADADPLIRAVAQFEAALRAALADDLDGDVVIDWDHHPDTVIDALVSCGDPAQARRGRFRTRVSTALPELVELL
jgi:hypothetical protein